MGVCVWYMRMSSVRLCPDAAQWGGKGDRELGDMRIGTTEAGKYKCGHRGTLEIEALEIR